MTTPPKKRGFNLADLTPERRREIASMGGSASKSRPFRDQPGLASVAAKSKKPIDTQSE